MTLESQMKQTINAVYKGRITGARDLAKIVTKVFETVDHNRMSTAQITEMISRAVDEYELELQRLMK